jgi:hypothetical protein
MMMEAVSAFEMSVIYKTTWHSIPEDCHLHMSRIILQNCQVIVLASIWISFCQKPMCCDFPDVSLFFNNFMLNEVQELVKI